MPKIPVFDTIGLAYRFAYLNFGAIFMTAGVPLLIAAVIGYFVQDAMLGMQIETLAGTGGDLAAASSRVLGYALGFNVVQAIFTSIAAVALHRIALFGPQAARLGVGPTEIAFMIVWLAFMVIMMIPIMLITVLDITPGSNPPPGLGGVVFAILIAYFAFAITSIRLLPVFPHLVATGEFAPRQAMAMTRGNWWRIFGCFFFAFLPLPIVAIGTNPIAYNPSLAQLSTAELIQIMTQAREGLIVSTVIMYVFGVLMTAIGIAILSYIYKILGGMQPGDLLPERD